ncbi:hypothetical protein THRCLA_05890 [Thraustotheca clavata]|uniref:Carbohydrate kinase FGGY N-terminal domain-containing protein n=1 Tax=Thraustotheca clavata TaxID=74557 RepID=A0A1V9ZRT5_9STRA|nr:hypothetical protein THRCLA_05890 [Thraustotheca clavata]
MQVLGIDVGTTAIKCSLVNCNKKLEKQSCKSIENASGSIVDVKNVLLAMQKAMKELGTMENVTAIALCGQMHGIVWWKANKVLEALKNNTDDTPWSDLITWQDKRCKKEFINELCHQRNLNGGIFTPLSSGYALATFAIMMQECPETIEKYDTCGTIMDLIAFLLAGHTSTKNATIDCTNAYSWGGFNTSTMSWDVPTLKAWNIPMHFMPRPCLPGKDIVGKTCSTASNVFNVPEQIPIYVPMGDHPCSVYALLHSTSLNAKDALLVNIGTSAQLAFVLEDNLPTTPSFEIRPYFNQQKIAVVAALTGGNVFAKFVENCIKWTFDMTNFTITDKDTAYVNIIAAANKNTTLVCRPTLLGERNEGISAGEIVNLTMDNWTLGDMSAAIAKGIVNNLFELLPPSAKPLIRHRTVIGSGNALVKNELLQHYTNELTGRPIVLAPSSDASFGASLLISEALPYLMAKQKHRYFISVCGCAQR